MVQGGDEARSGRYRDRVRGAARERRGALRYTDVEWDLVCRAAALDAMKPGAWAQEAAAEAARRRVLGGPGDGDQVQQVLVELRDQQRVLRSIGHLLNQFMKAVHAAEGRVSEPQALAVFRVARRTVERSEQVTADIRARWLS